MINLFFAFASGLIFGLGLILSGMTNPDKVLGFLDLAGNWNPSLAFVMVSGITIAALGFRLAKKMPVSLAGLPLHIPKLQIVDFKLIAGSLIFGLGWGLAGICPGPSFVLLGMGSRQGLIFAGAMVIGAVLFQCFDLIKITPENPDGDKLSN
jgi:hypothetical protein